MSMSNTPKSKMIFYSWGRAAENLPLDSNILKVIPVEHALFLDGQLKSNPTLKQVSGVDPSGHAQQNSAYTDVAIPATWYPAEGNRVRAPNIRRGERVEIWRFADRAEYLWRVAGLDNHLRRLETASWAFSATTDESTTKLTPDNSYWAEISAHQKTITLSTTMVNGEKVSFFVQFDMATGKFILKDSVGQSIYFDSEAHFIALTNADKCQLALNKQNISIIAQDTLAMQAKNAIQMSTQTLTINAPTINGNVDTIQLAGVTVENGTVTMGNLNVNGSSSLGDVKAGAINCESVKATGTVHGSNI